jgi:hypothetical protein
MLAMPVTVQPDVPIVPAPPGASQSTNIAAAQDGIQASGTFEPQTLVATPNVVEIGVATGTHGWLRIRAELQPESGQVSAAVIAISSMSVDALHRQLPSIAAYLASEQVNVGSLVVSRASASPAANDSASSDTAAGTPQQQRQDGGSQRQSNFSTSPSFAQEWQDAEPSGAMNAVSAIGASFGSGGGGWLNVIA